jgi:hypothetical protein
MFPKLTYNEKHSQNIYITIIRLNYQVHLLQDDNATCCLMNNYSLHKHMSDRDCIAPESQEGHLKLSTLHDRIECMELVPLAAEPPCDDATCDKGNRGTQQARKRSGHQMW